MKKFIRKVFPAQKNPFKSLLLTAALCAIFRVALIISGLCMLFGGHPFTGLITILIYPQIPDLLFLRPKLRKTFLTSSFLEEHITWLKERQDVSPDQLRVFFRKILSFRASASAIALGIAIPSFLIIRILNGPDVMLIPLFFSPIFYLVTLMIKTSLFHSEYLEYWPKRYRSDHYNFPYRIRIERN